MNELSVYHRIASALTVIEVAEPIKYRFECGTLLQTAYEAISEGDGQSCIALVTRGDSPFGFLEWPSSFDADRMNESVEQVATSIEIWRVVSAETTLLELIPLWHRSYYFFVLDGMSVSHFVARHDMDKAPVKAALFALTAELEEKMLRLLISESGEIEPRFNRLNSNSQNKARRLSRNKGLPDSVFAHIQNTFFKDKVEMFCATPELFIRLPFATETEGTTYFDFIGRLRNELAHGGSLFNVIQDATALKAVIELTETVLACLSSQRNESTNGTSLDTTHGPN